MRELAIGGACVAVLVVGLSVLSPAVDTSIRTPAHALELATVRAEAAAAKAEADQAKGEVERLKLELEKVGKEGERLKGRVAELEKAKSK